MESRDSVETKSLPPGVQGRSLHEHNLDEACSPQRKGTEVFRPLDVVPPACPTDRLARSSERAEWMRKWSRDSSAYPL